MSDNITKAAKRLGKRIQKFRQTNTKYTQEDLADRVGISRAHMGHIEQGRKNPSLKVVEKVAKVLKVKISDLLD